MRWPIGSFWANKVCSIPQCYCVLWIRIWFLRFRFFLEFKSFSTAPTKRTLPKRMRIKLTSLTKQTTQTAFANKPSSIAIRTFESIQLCQIWRRNFSVPQPLKAPSRARFWLCHSTGTLAALTPPPFPFTAQLTVSHILCSVVPSFHCKKVTILFSLSCARSLSLYRSLFKLRKVKWWIMSSSVPVFAISLDWMRPIYELFFVASEIRCGRFQPSFQKAFSVFYKEKLLCNKIFQLFQFGQI